MALTERAFDGSGLDPHGGITVLDLGEIDYQTGLSVQRDLVEKKKNGLQHSFILICEHSPVITYGRRARADNLLTSSESLKQLGIELCETNRGGDFTYHGPGMLVVYPIISLRAVNLDAISYLRFLEKTIIDVLANFNIPGLTVDGQTGVWVNLRRTTVQNALGLKTSVPKSRKLASGDHQDYGANKQHFEKSKSEDGSWKTCSDDTSVSEAAHADLKKICSIGIRVERGVAYHGLCLNVIKKPPFGLEFINPCGLNSSKYVFMDELIEEKDFRVIKEVAISVLVKNFGKIQRLALDHEGTLRAQKLNLDLFEN